jgi:CRP-like cAMP-binding protein
MYVTITNENSPRVAAPELSKPAVNTTSTRIKAGSYLFFEGDEVEWLYQITEGVMRLTKLLENGRRQVIAFGYPGDIVGFPSAGCHHTDCEALVSTSLQPYRISALEDGLGDPNLHQNLLQAALREISAMQDHFMMLGRKSAIEKVASFLCVLSKRVGEELGDYTQVDLPMCRSDIADFLGLTTETISRTFTQLRKSKIIAIHNNRTVIVLKPVALLGLSQGN